MKVRVYIISAIAFLQAVVILMSCSPGGDNKQNNDSSSVVAGSSEQNSADNSSESGTKDSKDNLPEPSQATTIDKPDSMVAHDIEPGKAAKSKPSSDRNIKKANTADNAINVKEAGAKGDGVTDDLPAIKAVMDNAIKSGKNVYFPAGKYMLSSYFPLRNQNGRGLLDCGNIEVYGEGKNSVIFTKGKGGIDVFQLNAIKNVTIRDLAITSEVGADKHEHGSNGVSISNGGQNIKLQRLTIYDLPYVDYAAYIDGGKGVTIQPANTTYPVESILVSNCNIRNCAYGLGMDLVGKAMSSNAPSKIVMESNTITNCLRGVSLGCTDDAGLENSLKNLGITIRNNNINNCKTGILLARIGNLKIENNSISRPKSMKQSNALALRSTSNSVKGNYGIIANGVVNSVISNNKVDCADCDEEIAIGTINSRASKVSSSTGNTMTGNTLKTKRMIMILDNKTSTSNNNIKQ